MSTPVSNEHRNSVSSSSSVGETVAPTVNSGHSSDKTAASSKNLGKDDAAGYKTKMCRNQLQKGYCPYEVKCMFAHSEAELRTRFQNLNEGISSQNVVQDIVRDRVTEHRKLAAQTGVQSSSLYLSTQLPTGLSGNEAKPLIGNPNVPVTIRVGGGPASLAPPVPVKDSVGGTASGKKPMLIPQQVAVTAPAAPIAAACPVAAAPVMQPQPMMMAPVQYQQPSQHVIVMPQQAAAQPQYALHPQQQQYPTFLPPQQQFLTTPLVAAAPMVPMPAAQPMVMLPTGLTH